MKSPRESGIALFTTILILFLMSALLVGFTIMVSSDQRLGSMDRDRTRALYAAHAGLEQMTADLGTLFSTNAAPTGGMVNSLTTSPPVVQGSTFTAPGQAAGTGYQILFPVDALGNPLAQNRTILSGPFQGFLGLITPYTMTVTARSDNGSEVRLRRVVQTVGIPVFQFGIFSETDLSFFAGPPFNFGGRTHTNGNLYLAEGSSNTLTLGDRVTVVGEAIRTNLSNGWNTSVNYTGNVSIIRAPGLYRNLLMSEGSLVGNLGSPLNEPTWTNLSIGTYNGNLRNGRTGARALNLPLVTLGARPIDLIARPLPNEDVNNAAVFAQRFFTNNPGDQITSLRILLSDTPADILSLPTVTPNPPMFLGNQALAQASGLAIPGTAIPAGGGVITPLALSNGTTNTGARVPTGTPLTGGGYIKIEMFSTAANAWVDVTAEIMNLGFTGRNLSNGTLHVASTACVEPNPNAIIRIQRLRDVPASGSLPCGNGSLQANDYWPNALYDAREGFLRDSAAANQINLGGIMHYIEIDVNNLRRWFLGQIGFSGTNAVNVNGYVVYISDRRNNRDAAANETGEYGFEDFVNPLSGTGTPNAILDTGEDVNSNGTLETYGQIPLYPSAPGLPPTTAQPAGWAGPLDSGARPWNNVTRVTTVPLNSGAVGSVTNMQRAIARGNPTIFFRRAVVLVNGRLGNLPTPGLTVAAENPVYIRGDYNASALGPGFGSPHAACSVIADSVTLLSNNWNDILSFNTPHSPGGRAATTSWYRTAIISGKGRSFPQPTGTAQDFGTDGGVHNFLRYIETWSGQTLNYRGSIVSFYFNRQAVGTYKCCATVYSPPSRGYNFDTDFLTPALLPPRTPMFRDVNTIGFTQIVNPNQP
jgi:hypothetical protein